MAREGRGLQELRTIKLTRHFIRHPEGAVLVEFGDTRVICTASDRKSVV